MTSKEALTNLKLECSVKGKLSKFQQICFECLEKEFENPILLDCIKEWNEKGFNVDIYAVEIIISNYSTVDKEEDEIEISIRLDKKAIFYVNDVELSFDLHHLLSKTLKALEDKDEQSLS